MESINIPTLGRIVHVNMNGWYNCYDIFPAIVLRENGITPTLGVFTDQPEEKGVQVPGLLLQKNIPHCSMSDIPGIAHWIWPEIKK